jgi:hypothetical protein
MGWDSEVGSLLAKRSLTAPATYTEEGEGEAWHQAQGRSKEENMSPKNAFPVEDSLITRSRA